MHPPSSTSTGIPSPLTSPTSHESHPHAPVLPPQSPTSRPPHTRPPSRPHTTKNIDIARWSATLQHHGMSPRKFGNITHHLQPLISPTATTSNATTTTTATTQPTLQSSSSTESLDLPDDTDTKKSTERTSSAPTTTTLTTTDTSILTSQSRRSLHVQALSEAEKEMLFEALPSLRSIEQVTPHSQGLRHSTLRIIRDWLTEKMANSTWVNMVQNIRALAEGDTHTHLTKTQALTIMGLDRRALLHAGLPEPVVNRVYRALWVYSLGIHELMQEVAHHCQRHASGVVGAVWKAYAILLEAYGGDQYVTALTKVEQESQRALKRMNDKFDRRMIRTQEIEQKAQMEVSKLSQLLDRSQLEARTLLEKKESLMHQIHNLEQERSDQEGMLADLKKKLWQSQNHFNRVAGALENLERTAAQTQIKMEGTIRQLNAEQIELKTSLEVEVQIHENLEHELERAQTRLNDLTVILERTRAELDETRADHATMTRQLAEWHRRFETYVVEKSNLERHVNNLEGQLNHALMALEVAKNATNMNMNSDAARDAELEADLKQQQIKNEEYKKRIIKYRKRLIQFKRITRGLTATIDSHIRAAATSTSPRKDKSSSSTSTSTTSIISPTIYQLDSDDESDAEIDAESSDDDGAVDQQLHHVIEQMRGTKKHDKKKSSGDDGKKDGKKTSNMGWLSLADHQKYTQQLAQQAAAQAELQKECDTLKNQLYTAENNARSISKSVHAKDELIAELRAKLKRQDRTVNKKLQSVQEMREASQQAMAILEQDYKAVVTECNNLRQQYTEIRDRKTELENVMNELQADLTEAKSTLRAWAKERTVQKELTIAIKTENKELRQECDNRAKNQQEMGLKLRALQADLVATQSKLESFITERTAAAESSSLLGSLDQKASEIKRLLSKVREVEHQKADLIRQYEIKLAEVIRTTREEWEKKLAAATASAASTSTPASTDSQLQSLQQQIKDMKRDHVKEMSVMKRSYEKEKETNVELQKRITKLEEQLATRVPKKTTNDETTKLEEQLFLVKNELAGMEAERDEWRSKFRKLSKSNDRTPRTHSLSTSSSTDSLRAVSAASSRPGSAERKNKKTTVTITAPISTTVTSIQSDDDVKTDDGEETGDALVWQLVIDRTTPTLTPKTLASNSNSGSNTSSTDTSLRARKDRRRNATKPSASTSSSLAPRARPRPSRPRSGSSNPTAPISRSATSSPTRPRVLKSSQSTDRIDTTLVTTNIEPAITITATNTLDTVEGTDEADDDDTTTPTSTNTTSDTNTPNNHHRAQSESSVPTPISPTTTSVPPAAAIFTTSSAALTSAPSSTSIATANPTASSEPSSQPSSTSSLTSLAERATDRLLARLSAAGKTEEAKQADEPSSTITISGIDQR